MEWGSTRTCTISCRNQLRGILWGRSHLEMPLPKLLGWGRDRALATLFIQIETFFIQRKRLMLMNFCLRVCRAVAAGIHTVHHNQWEFNSEKKDE